jgi:hypothetical protein
MGRRHDALIEETGQPLRLHGRPRRELKRRTARSNRQRSREALRQITAADDLLAG